MRANLQFPADLATFTEEILYGKLHFFVQCQNYLVETDKYHVL